MEACYDINLSIIMKCACSIDLALEQVSQIHQIVHSSSLANKNYEIIYLITPKHKKENRQLERITSVYSSFRPLLSETAGNDSFKHAVLRAKGQYIIDADCLSQEINYIPYNEQPYLVLTVPQFKSDSFPASPKDFSIVSVVSKSVGMLLFSRVHMNNDGSSSEIVFLCEPLHIPVSFRHTQVIQYEYSFLKNLYIRSLSEIMKYMYKYGFWTFTQKTIRDYE